MSQDTASELSTGDRVSIPLTVRELDDDENHACEFCSTIEHGALVHERGLVPADFELQNVYGVPFGYACEMCIVDAPSPDQIEVL